MSLVNISALNSRGVRTARVLLLRNWSKGKTRVMAGNDVIDLTSPYGNRYSTRILQIYQNWREAQPLFFLEAESRDCDYYLSKLRYIALGCNGRGKRKQTSPLSYLSPPPRKTNPVSPTQLCLGVDVFHPCFPFSTWTGPLQTRMCWHFSWSAHTMTHSVLGGPKGGLGS